MRLKIIIWLVACSFSCCLYSTPSADSLLRSEGRGSEAGSRDQQVPGFMMKLYKSVNTGNGKLSVGNTVRSMAGQFSMFIAFTRNSLHVALIHCLRKLGKH